MLLTYKKKHNTSANRNSMLSICVGLYVLIVKLTKNLVFVLRLSWRLDCPLYKVLLWAKM